MKIVSMKLHIFTFLHNYFIMHDIKYFFLNKNNQTISREGEGDKFFFPGETDYRKYYLKTLFFKFRTEQLPPLTLYRFAPNHNRDRQTRRLECLTPPNSWHKRIIFIGKGLKCNTIQCY
jgi:hypothetical protein